MLLPEIAALLSDEYRLRKDDLLVLGVSGGADSMCLMHLLHELPYPLVIAHLDHTMRTDSAADAAFVQAAAAELDLPFEGGKQDVRTYAEAKHMNLEEAARELRYRFLFGVAEAREAQAVIVAHTADDQAETILMNLLRGAGPAGLSGMPLRAAQTPWSEQIPLLRPLLRTSRQAVEDYCAANGIRYLQDPSNADTSLLRNKLRHDVMPALQAINPNLGNALQNTADIIAADDELLNALTAKAWSACLIDSTEQHLAFDRLHFEQQALAIQRRLIRKAHQHLTPEEAELSFEGVGQLLDFLADSGENARLEWRAGLDAILEGQ